MECAEVPRLGVLRVRGCVPPPLGRSPLYALWCSVYGVNSEHLKRRVFFFPACPSLPAARPQGVLYSLSLAQLRLYSEAAATAPALYLYVWRGRVSAPHLSHFRVNVYIPLYDSMSISPQMKSRAWAGTAPRMCRAAARA